MQRTLLICNGIIRIKMTYNKQKKKPEDLTVQSAKYVQDFMIAITFTNGRTTVFDFLPLFHKYVKGENIKYFAPQNFKKFLVKNGNIYWGRNEDVIFLQPSFLTTKMI